MRAGQRLRANERRTYYPYVKVLARDADANSRPEPPVVVEVAPPAIGAVDLREKVDAYRALAKLDA